MEPFAGAAVAIVVIRCGRTWLSCFIACLLACGMVAALTLGSNMPPSCNWNDRSKIAQYSWLLCGTTARGEIFWFGGWSSHRVSHAMSFAWPFLTLSNASSRRHALAWVVFADGWAPHLTAALRWCGVHGSPQSTGHPFFA